MKKKEKRCKKNLRDSGNTIKQTNICIVGFPEREERGKGVKKKLFEEIMAKSFLNFMEDMNL